MMTSFDTNKDKVCLLFKNDVGGSHVRSRARLHNPGSCDPGVTIAFLFGISSDKQVIVKSYLQLGEKLLNPTREKGGKPMFF